MLTEKDADLIEALLGEGLLSSNDLARALAQGPRSEETVEQILLERTHLTRDQLASARARAHVGSSVAKYRLLRSLGQGGMGEVFLALDTALHRVVALKCLKGDDVYEVVRFKKEAILAARLNHPNIVQIYEVGEADGCHFISMQYISGESLSRKRVTRNEALGFVRAAALAAHYAHGMGIIHRDIKPSNLLVVGADGSSERRSHVYLIDFGIAKRVGGETSVMSRKGDVLGSPAFMSPEQAAGASARITPATDVYGLGATLYFLLTGRAPFESERPDRLATMIQGGLGQIDPSIPRDIEAIVRKSMATKQEERYATAQALADDLGRSLRNQRPLARPRGGLIRWFRSLFSR